MKAYFIVLIVLGCLVALILYMFLRIRCEKRERKISNTSQESTASGSANGDVEIGKGKRTNSVKDGDMVILAGDGAVVEAIANIGTNIVTQNNDFGCFGCGGDGGGCGGGCGKKKEVKNLPSQRSVTAANGDVEIGGGKGISRSVNNGNMVILAGDGGRVLAPAAVVASTSSNGNFGSSGGGGCGGGGDGGDDGGCGGGGCGGCDGCGG
ncbi:uncharacterized protein LOC110733698 [Chenopodium quinoa]|uniref:uncharacterized protein LOC110733698 n=1 Tax=Chenopodium quinoa TaxID=63459 RepID=UPI000B793409|nr:uncharacterized protein LOC110733698 [Chenopodium quinoa]